MAKLFSNAAERRFTEAVGRLVYVNPFLPARITFEREALGDEFSDAGPVWSAIPGVFEERPNVVRLNKKVEKLAEQLRSRLTRMTRVESSEMQHYADLIYYVLYYGNWRLFDDMATDPMKARCIPGFKGFVEQARYFFACNSAAAAFLPLGNESHLFALFYQIRRAFQAIFMNIIGTSMPVAQLRAAVWQSIFTCDLAAYRNGLFDRLHDVPSLITGPSGTGKELVARAVAQAAYIPFDPKTETFASAPGKLFLPLNLSAMSPTLVESELFGHRRGAFTGALEDRVGWLEHCRPGGAVFLDEIGELDPQIQVKLLRVLQTRSFQRLGESETRTFAGKIIAATNRNLSIEMRERRFRPDLYYRLCADLISTPALAEQLAGSTDRVAELRLLVRFIAIRVAGVPLADSLTDRVVNYVVTHIGAAYSWPGNFRELEQCVRNILIRGEYHPANNGQDETAAAHIQLAQRMQKGNLTADEVVDQYVALVYAAEGSFEGTARRVKLDRRTVRARLARLHLLA